MDGVLHVADGDVAKAAVGRLLHLVGVGAVIEHLLHLPEVHGGGDHVEEVTLRPQDAAEFLDGQRGEAVQQQVDTSVRHRQAVGGGHSQLQRMFPLGGQPENEFGDVCTGHAGRFTGLTQGTVDGGGVISLAAAAVQHCGSVAGQRNGKFT